MRLTSHSRKKIERFIKKIMKKTSLKAWAGDHDPERIYDLHRGLLIHQFMIKNSTKTETALKMALSRFK